MVAVIPQTRAGGAAAARDWLAGSTEFPNRCAHELFEQQAARTPDAVALVHAGQAMRYRELNARANQVARHLWRRGAGPESLVGVCLNRSPDLLVALLGVWKAGAAYVPLDPGDPPERLAFMVRDAELRLMLSERRCRGLFAPGTVETLCLDADWPTIAQERSGNLAAAVTPANLAYVMYTSGSTGQPKGAMIVHGGLVNYLCWAIGAYGLEADAAVVVHSSVAFDLTVTSLYPPLLVGGQVELLGEDDGARHLVAALRQGKGRSLLKITPAHLDLLAQQLGPAEMAQVARTVVIGGEQLFAERLRPWRRHAPHARLINEYGPTETVVGCCTYELRADDPDSGPVPIGRPIANTRLYVLDPAFHPLPPGVTGELYIGGIGVARGYLNRPELTRERFVADPFSSHPDARLYRTGDLARYRADGILEYVGRADDQVKLLGFRIEPGEIEAHLAAHPDVAACAVAVRESAGGERRLIAYVVPRRPAEPGAGQLRDFLARHVPHYMLPARFVTLPQLPLTRNGKIDRNALPAPSAAAPADGDRRGPRDAVEQTLASIWRELLDVPTIGIDDDFFDLGGHSLLALKAVSRLRDAFGVDLRIETLFHHPTIAALAAVLNAGSTVPGPPPIRPRRPGTAVPLSFAQEHLWFMDRLVPGNPAYTIVDMIRLRGPYDGRALSAALHDLVERHEILRTVFPESAGGAVQVVLAQGQVALAEHDLATRPAAEREAEWRRLAAQAGKQAFNLARLPLLRWTVVHLGELEHRLLLVMHHILADEWGLERLQQEVRQLYAAHAAGRQPALDELPIQYGDFACWQRERLQGDFLRRQFAYWKTALAGAPTQLALATDRPRPAVQRYCGATERFTVPAALAERLKALGRSEQATLFMVLESVFMALLRRYTGQDDILAGTPFSGRTQSETEKLVGYFLNILVLRARFEPGMSFRQLLRQQREVALGAYAHAELPFQQLVAEMAPHRDPARSPVFQVMCVLREFAGEVLPSVYSGHEELAGDNAKFDLTLLFSENGDSLDGFLEYSTDLFEAETVQRMVGHCLMLLEAVAADPDQAVDRLPLLTAAERHRQLVEWNARGTEYPAGALLHRLFEAQAGQRPEAVAVIGSGSQLSYGELDARSNQLARQLQQHGVGPDCLVAVHAERSPELVVALLAILKAGGAWLPIDPDCPPARLARLLDEARPVVVLGQGHLCRRLPASAPPALCLDDDWAAIAAQAATPVASPVAAQHLAYVIYTSGSTGQPKGVAIPHAAICNHMFWLQRTHPLFPSDALLQKTPFTFDAAVWEFFAPLLAGARLVMARPDGHLDPAYLAQTILDQRVSILQLVPSQLRMLLAEPSFARCAPPLRQVFCGGEALTPDLVGEFRRQLPQVRLGNLYGPTEATIDTTCWDCPDDGELTTVPIGRPIDNVRVYIANAQLQLQPVGVPGELLIGGRGLARGYLGPPRADGTRFVADPFAAEPDARLYRSGDLARYLPDGNIEYLGRLDEQIKIRGYRIEPGEIEHCIAAHPAVAQAVVVARDDVSGTRQLIAYLVAAQPPADLADQLRVQIRAALPEYMLPAAFVTLPALPLTASGKIDRQALPAPVAEAARAARAVAPRTATEAQILDIFQAVLGHNDFGVFDSFFDLGGHSIMAAQLVHRLQQATGLELPLRHLFERPTAAGLAETVDSLAWVARGVAAGPSPARDEIEL
ncbi:MAG TPA: amino acid adenylation domain-containing protein [Azonexus sp.]